MLSAPEYDKRISHHLTGANHIWPVEYFLNAEGVLHGDLLAGSWIVPAAKTYDVGSNRKADEHKNDGGEPFVLSGYR